MIVGLCGAAGCGKSTVAERLRDRHKFFDFALADPLYEMVAAMLGRPKEWLKDRANKEAVIDWVGRSPRRLLQLLGTEFGRGLLDDEIWIRHLLRRIDATTDAMHRYWSQPVAVNFSVSDVRFDNEAAAIRERGGVIWQVVRPGQAMIAGGHASECGISPALVDRVIANDSDLEALGAAVDEAWHSLQDGRMEVA